ncbi:hypothetical protein CRG98_024576 [Punica granatum]|uniref:Reverse transcriptase Ty1/copia-type domain-containing protein n=1 Tax=Punica granatum TaxID=22663 RepID=A0A2I0JGJ5_PUNGR|nr:hypothetical protein CRG98_024576 [Punica granatum]
MGPHTAWRSAKGGVVGPTWFGVELGKFGMVDPGTLLQARGEMVEGDAFMVSPQDDGEPRSIQEAFSFPARKERTNAMNEEMEFMRTNRVWDLVDLPPRRKTIGNKWILKRCKGNFLILSLYVDGILMAGNNKQMLVKAKEWFSANFEMKDMGEADYVLGIKILRDRSRRLLKMSQENYIKNILERF